MASPLDQHIVYHFERAYCIKKLIEQEEAKGNDATYAKTLLDTYLKSVSNGIYKDYPQETEQGKPLTRTRCNVL